MAYPATPSFNDAGDGSAWWREATDDGEWIHSGAGRSIVRDVQTAIVAKMQRLTSYNYPRSANRPFASIARPGDLTGDVPGAVAFAVDAAFGGQTTAMLWNLAGGNLAGTAPRWPQHAASAERDLTTLHVSPETLQFALWIAYGSEAPIARRVANLTSPYQIAISPGAVMPPWDRQPPSEAHPGAMTRVRLEGLEAAPADTHAADIVPPPDTRQVETARGMSTGAAVALSLGGVAGLFGLGGFVVWLSKRKRKRG